MSRINKNYARNFNDKYNFVGHVFQCRYNGEIIENDEYVLEASRYIHLNPVRANMVEAPENYQWSSYNMVIGNKKEKIIDSRFLLNYFKYNHRVKLYRKFVESNLEIVYPMGPGLKQIIVNLMSSFREFYSCDLNHIFINL